MALNYVTLTVNVFDATGNVPQSGTATFTPSAALTDSTNHQYVPQIPIVVPFTVPNSQNIDQFTGGVPPTVSLLATDNATMLPSGWAWTVTFAGFKGAPPAFNFFLPFSGGAAQNLSDLTPVSSVTTMAAFLQASKNLSDLVSAAAARTNLGLGSSALLPALLPFTIKSGAYVQGQAGVNTNAGLGQGTLRLVPFYLAQAATIAAIGCEFTSAGDAASVLRMAVYSDDGTGYPNALLLDGGSISTGSGNAGTVATGGTPGVYMNTGITALALQPGLYWTGGAIQGVTVTQPTIRIASFLNAFAAVVNSVPGAGASAIGYSANIGNSAPSTPFPAWASNVVGAAPRIVFKLQ